MTSKVASADVVAYIGTYDAREIDAAAWKGAGAGGQGKVVWNKENKFQVPVDQFTPEALAYIETDDALVVRPFSVK